MYFKVAAIILQEKLSSYYICGYKLCVLAGGAVDKMSVIIITAASETGFLYRGDIKQTLGP